MLMISLHAASIPLEDLDGQMDQTVTGLRRMGMVLLCIYNNDLYNTFDDAVFPFDVCTYSMTNDDLADFGSCECREVGSPIGRTDPELILKEAALRSEI